MGDDKVTFYGATLSEAVAERARLMAEVASAPARAVSPAPAPARGIARRRGIVTLSAFAVEYLALLKKDGRALNTLRNVEDDLLGLILPPLGHLPLCDATFSAELMDQYRAELVSRMADGEISDRAVCQALKTLRAMLARRSAGST